MSLYHARLVEVKVTRTSTNDHFEGVFLLLSNSCHSDSCNCTLLSHDCRGRGATLANVPTSLIDAFLELASLRVCLGSLGRSSFPIKCHCLLLGPSKKGLNDSSSSPMLTEVFLPKGWKEEIEWARTKLTLINPIKVEMEGEKKVLESPYISGYKFS